MTTSEMIPTQVEEIMGGLTIINGDSHFPEPADLWTSRAPAKYKNRVPASVAQAARRSPLIVERLR